MTETRAARSTSIYNEKTRKIDKRKRQSAIILVFATVLIDMLGIFLTIPILANLTREIQGEPSSCCPVEASKCEPATIYYPDRDPQYDYYAADDPDIPDKCVTARINANSNIGLANTMYATGTFISTFWMPKVSDRYGRRPAFFLSLQGSLVGFLLFAFAADFTMLLCVRFIAGMFGGSAVIGNAYITDVYEPHERGPMFARMGATIMMSVLIGPMMGGGLVTLFSSLRAPLYVASGFCFVALIFAYFYIKEPRDLWIEDTNAQLESMANADEVSKAKEEEEGEPKEHHDPNYNPWKIPFNIALACQTFCTTAAFSGLTALMALLLLEPRYKVVNQNDSIEDQGQDMALQLGFNTMIIAVCSVPTMLIAFPKMIKALGLLPTGAVGSVMFGLSIFFLPFTLNRTAFMLLLPLIGIANGLQMNVSTIALSENAPPAHIASTLAVKQTADALASMLGPFLTLLYRDGIKPPYMVAGSFGIFAGVLLLGMAIAKRVQQGPPKAVIKEYHDEWESYSPILLDELEAEARALPPRCAVLGQPQIDERLIEVMFADKKPGVDYDEQFAKDLVGYFDLLYTTMKNQGHLQLVQARPYEHKLDALAQKKHEDLEAFNKERAQMLHLQNIRRKTTVIEKTIIERAYPFLPDVDQNSLESRIEFLKSIHDILLNLGFDEWAGTMGERLQYVTTSLQLGQH
mmetsp:Transcript_36841/g.47600  ORF Transcript_36841/g.47600 Transcript_36841/m.47600 type:complete len:690 (-) Transcript_36841:151-2220(-)